MFDVNKLSNFAIKSIEEFIHLHSNETFYGVAIDANYLLMNSLEAYNKSLESYKKKFPEFYDRTANEKAIKALQMELGGDDEFVLHETEGRLNLDKNIENLKYNTGDWYQVAEFNQENGFDKEAYQEHYNLDDAKQETSKYNQAMNQVLNILKENPILNRLNKTDEFSVKVVEHKY